MAPWRSSKKNQHVAVEPYADPVPQALLLTAIVIGFGLQALAIVLIRKVYQSFKSNNLDDLNRADRNR